MQNRNRSILKRRHIVSTKKNILLGIFRKRQQFNEFNTIKTVEKTRRLVDKKVEEFFMEKQQFMYGLLPELMIGHKDCTDLFHNNDLEILSKLAETIIRNELFQRFKVPVVWNLKRTNNIWSSDILSSINKYQETKKRTVLITSCMETFCRRNLSDSLDLLTGNSLIPKLLFNLDISTMILPKLGINSSLETLEFKEELNNRIGGAFDSIKVGLIQEMNQQIAKIFYETHDLLLNSKFEVSINLLEEEVNREEFYEINLMRA